MYTRNRKKIFNQYRKRSIYYEPDFKLKETDIQDPAIETEKT